MRVYSVWVPILKSDVEGSVTQATGQLPDERVSHFWDGNGELVKGYSRVMKFGDEQPAWDVYFVFDRDAEWKDEPPAPAYWMHQLKLAPEKRFDGDKLAAEINKLLQSAGQR
ncbi:MAG: hypothetical protein M3R15_00310 [Acidobacteriota bacterium]|nr:hypothetical protein [Acidobacteriota bacterium]